ncbi:MAG: ABC transporter substrate-binding protein [Oscillospiraceae bacterium]|nr:ABC transporter substrate-binding protein [Oscillospiraceae bacterium]
MKKNKTLRLIAIVITLALCMSFVAACGNNATTGTETGTDTPTTPTTPPTVDAGQDAPMEMAAPEEGANLADHINIINDATDITVLNINIPAGATASTSQIYDLIQDRLMANRGGDNWPEPLLALDWSSEDAQTIRVNLRQGVYFHNGAPFTADDVAFTVEISHANPGGTAFARWREVERVDVIDDYTVDIVLVAPNLDWRYILSHWATPILSRQAYLDNPNDPVAWGSVGTGPYRVTGFSTANFVNLERNEDYWGPLPPTRSLTFWTIPEMATRTVMMQNGQAQVSFTMDPSDLDLLEADPNFTVFRHEGWLFTISFNFMGDEIQQCPYFRRAVAHALNVDDIAMVANGQWAMPTPDGNIWGLITPYRLEGLPRREHDIALAVDYLERSVYDGRTVDMRVAGDAAVRAAELVQMQLATIGVDINVIVMDVPSWVEAHAWGHELETWLFSVAAGPSAIGYVSGILAPGIGTNRSNINDPYFTDLIERFLAETDEAAARELAHAMQRWLYDDLIIIPLWYLINGIPAVNGIGGMHLWGNMFTYSLRGIYWDLDQAADNLRP